MHGGRDGYKTPPPVGSIEVDRTETLALMNTGATINILDISMLHKLKTRTIVMSTNARIYPHGSTTPVVLGGVIDTIVKNGAEHIRTAFYVAEGKIRTLLGCSASEALRLVSFAQHVRRKKEATG